MLFGDTAKMIVARLRLGFVVEKRRVTGVSHKIGNVLARRENPAVRRGGIQYDHHSAGLQPGDDLRSDQPDEPVRNGQDHRVSFGDRLVGSDWFKTQRT